MKRNAGVRSARPLSRGQVARLLGLTENAVAEMDGRQLHPARLSDRRWCYDVEEVRALLGGHGSAVRPRVSPADGPTTAAVFQAAGRPQLLPSTTLLGLAALLPLLWVLTSRYGTTGAALAMVLGLTPVAGLRVALASRIVGARPVEVARALATPVLCAALLAAALLGLTAATEDLGPGTTLSVLTVGGFASYALAARLFARSILDPIVAGFRRMTT